MIRSKAQDDASEGGWDGERNARTGKDVDIMLKLKKEMRERLVPLREKRAAAKKTGSRRSINWLL
jgi:hypothetical protein